MLSLALVLLLAQPTPVFEAQLILAKNLPIVTLPANGGQELKLIVDTGAGRSVVDMAWIGKLGLKDIGPVRAMGAGGTADARLLEGFRVSLGDTKLPLPAVGLQLGAIGAALGLPIQGILGYEFFAGRVVELDYPAKRMRIWDSKSYSAPSGAVELPVKFVGNRPEAAATIKLTTGKTADGRFTFDTGSTASITLSEAFAKANDIEIKMGQGFGGGVGGMRRRREADIAGVTLARLAFDRKLAAIEHVRSGQNDGLIGSALLVDHRVIMDYGRSRILFVK